MMASTQNEMLEYRLVIHKLSAPTHFIDYLHNYQYSFLWKSVAESYSISTDQYSFDNKTCIIDFNKTKLKLRLNEYDDNNQESEIKETEQESLKYTATKLILCEQQINRDNEEIINLDEITLTTNYFVVNKKQATNITFNKIVANDIRIELKLGVTLIAKQS